MCMHLFDGKEEREGEETGSGCVWGKIKQGWRKKKKWWQKRQKLGETLQKLLLSISHWKPLVNLFTEEFLCDISASLKGHLKGVQLTSLPCGGDCLTQNQVFLLRSAQFVVLRPALEDLWFLSCCFFYKYIQEIFFCKVDQKMSLVAVLRQEAASRYFCLAYWRAERETGCLRHMQPPPPSVCLSVWAVNGWSTISASCFFSPLWILCGI